MNRQILIDYAKEKYKTEPEYLWLKYPSYAVFRHSDSKKWYGLIADVPKNKLGLEGSEKVDVLNVKCEGLVADMLKQNRGFLPGWHMNKKYWISILLDGTVENEKIFDLLDMSFELTADKKKR
ncbi:MAG: MmcQ/YjbR family DNA-binding protein [Clostridiales bacterium]|nr:MmcQ/YjbR family DNA-binding protein [Clostridiales bacterium]